VTGHARNILRSLADSLRQAPTPFTVDGIKRVFSGVVTSHTEETVLSPHGPTTIRTLRLVIFDDCGWTPERNVRLSVRDEEWLVAGISPGEGYSRLTLTGLNQ
jgi:hypothetical protein